MLENVFNYFRKAFVTVLVLGAVSLKISGQADTWQVERLPDLVNSPQYDEIAPVPTRDGRSLFFTRVGYPEFERTLIFDTINYAEKLKSEKYLAMLSDLYAELGQTVVGNPSRSKFNQDVWWAPLDSSGNAIGLEHPGYPLNNALTNSLVTITPDPQVFYILNQFKPTGDMKRGFSKIRRNTDSTWTFPQPIEIKDYYTITSEVNLTMSFDGKTLIIAAARFDSRDLDLYICRRESADHWGAPVNLGPSINSAKRDLTPFLSEDNRTLFFASSRSSNTGSLDLYMSRRLDDTWQNWSPPVQLVAPINSSGNETQPYFNFTTGYLFFVSDRSGSNDIYRVRIAPPQPTELTVRGRVVNRRTRELVTNATIRYGVSTDGMGGHLKAEDGMFSLKVPKGVRFDLVAEKPGFTGLLDTLFFRLDYYYFKDYYTIDLLVDPLEAGSKIELQPIFFQQSKAIILEESFPELERLVALLNSNPGIYIQVEGHTDNVGQVQDLLQLSKDRAEAVKKFLVEHGISVERITTDGLGPGAPLNDNSTEDLRRQNRRVEIIILKI